MPKQNKKDTTLLIRLSKALKKALQTQAASRALDMSTYARMLISDGLKRKNQETRGAK